MPLFAASQDWLEQSSLLLQARPATTRITTTYTISNPSSSTNRASRKRKAGAAAPAADDSSAPAPAADDGAAAPTQPRGSLTLKTFDPVSGVCLKYSTTKQAEVGRLVASLGRLGRHMAALPETTAAIEEDAGVEGGEIAAGAASGPAPAAATAAPAAPGSGGGGGAKKKKKGKK